MQKFISAYNASGGNPAQINLSNVREQIDPLYRDRIDLYLINASGVIEYTTKKDEYMMDFGVWPDFLEKIKRMMTSDEFVPDEIVQGFIKGSPLRKFVYQPTPDHHYIAQISLNVQNTSVKERNSLSYGSLTSYVINQSPDLISLHVISSMGNLVIGKRDYLSGRLDPESRNISGNVFKTKTREVIPDPNNQTITTYIFVPNTLDETPSATYMNLVGKFVFSTQDLNRQQINNLLLHFLLVILGSLFAILFAALLTNRLTSPLNQLVREIDLIAEGNLDQHISPTRHPELGRIADATRVMVDQISRIIKDLKASESRFRALFNTATDAILILEGDLILDANPAADTLFSEQEESLAGRYISGICPQAWTFIKDTGCIDSGSSPFHDSPSILPSLSICEEDIRIEDEGKKERIFNIRVIPLDPGDYSLYQVQIRDVTRRVEMEVAIKDLNTHLEQQVKERTSILEATIADLDSFTYTVSHDLRSPLRAIDGNAYILELKGRDMIPAELLKHITKIHENIKRMDYLIDDLLKFSRMSRKPLEKTEINMNDLVREVTDELIISVSGHQTVLSINDLPPAYGDLSLVRQVLINLTSNALKFGKTQTTNEICISSFSEDGRVWYLIQDTGLGFDMEFAERIFEVFLQLHPAGTYEGTGVGLAIVKRIIFRHRGAIRVKSKQGEGSTFMFTLDQGKTGIYLAD